MIAKLEDEEKQMELSTARLYNARAGITWRIVFGIEKKVPTAVTERLNGQCLGLIRLLLGIILIVLTFT